MEKQICPGCKTEYLDALPEKCTKCNYPFSGTKKEQGRFIAQQIIMNCSSGITDGNLLGNKQLLII